MGAGAGREIDLRGPSLEKSRIYSGRTNPGTGAAEGWGCCCCGWEEGGGGGAAAALAALAAMKVEELEEDARTRLGPCWYCWCCCLSTTGLPSCMGESVEPKPPEEDLERKRLEDEEEERLNMEGAEGGGGAGWAEKTGARCCRGGAAVGAATAGGGGGAAAAAAAVVMEVMTTGVGALTGTTAATPPTPPAMGGQVKEKSSQATLVQIFAGPSEALERESISMNSPCVPWITRAVSRTRFKEKASPARCCVKRERKRGWEK